MAHDVTLERYSAEHRAAWDAFVQKSQNCHFMHYRGYMDYHADRFSDHSYMAYEAGKIVGLWPANALDGALISHQGLTFGGPIVAAKPHAPTVIEMMAALSERARADGFARLQVKVLPDCFSDGPRHDILYALHDQGWTICRRDLSSVISLRDPIGYNGQKKSNLRRSKKVDLHIVEDSDPADYWAILEDVLKARHGETPTHSLAEIRLLMARFPDHIKLYCAALDDEVLAGTVVFLNRRAVHTQYLASSPKGRETAALDFLLDRLIQRYQASHDWFSLGISTTNQGKDLNTGLLLSKEGFGARGLVHDFYEKIL